MRNIRCEFEGNCYGQQGKFRTLKRRMMGENRSREVRNWIELGWIGIRWRVYKSRSRDSGRKGGICIS